MAFQKVNPNEYIASKGDVIKLTWRIVYLPPQLYPTQGAVKTAVEFSGKYEYISSSIFTYNEGDTEFVLFIRIKEDDRADMVYSQASIHPYIIVTALAGVLIFVLLKNFEVEFPVVKVKTPNGWELTAGGGGSKVETSFGGAAVLIGIAVVALAVIFYR